MDALHPRDFDGLPPQACPWALRFQLYDIRLKLSRLTAVKKPNCVSAMIPRGSSNKC